MSNLPDQICLAFQRSSLGEIYAEIRCIAVGYSNDKTLTIRYYLDRSPIEDDYECLGELMTEILSDLPADAVTSVIEECIFSREIQSNLDPLDGFLYARRERLNEE